MLYEQVKLQPYTNMNLNAEQGVGEENVKQIYTSKAKTVSGVQYCSLAFLLSLAPTLIPNTRTSLSG